MTWQNLKREAQENLRLLMNNEYPGRGIILGRAQDGSRLIQAYWLMGRSENSRNRILLQRGATVRAAAADPAKLQDPSLVIYAAMREAGGHFLVSNGDHTDALADGILAGKSFQEVMLGCEHEPDDPHWTPRIAGDLVVAAGSYEGQLAIAKADPFDSARSVHQFFHYQAFEPGFGWCVTTYRGNRNPLPSFTGEPLLMPLGDDAETIADTLWNHLNGENRVALAVKSIDPASGQADVVIRNKLAPVKAERRRA